MMFGCRGKQVYLRNLAVKRLGWFSVSGMCARAVIMLSLFAFAPRRGSDKASFVRYRYPLCGRGSMRAAMCVCAKTQQFLASLPCFWASLVSYYDAVSLWGYIIMSKTRMLLSLSLYTCVNCKVNFIFHSTFMSCCKCGLTNPKDANFLLRSVWKQDSWEYCSSGINVTAVLNIIQS